nr:unnamed protein product [Callosobruchus analis]
MQNVQEVLTVPRAEKPTPSDLGLAVSHQLGMTPHSPAVELLKKVRVAQPREIECRVPRVTTDRYNQGLNFTPTAIIADKYQIFEQVEGSSLYRCVDINTKEELVCKIVSRDSHSLVSAHYRLDYHLRVARLREVVARDRYLYLVFPPAHGDLHSYVRCRKRLREPEARRLFRQIAETVRVCHEHGIVLRDLKLRKFVFADEAR